MNERMERLTFWCQKVIPLVYDDSLSYYELLCKVVDYLNNLINNQNNIKDILIAYGQNIETLKSDVSFLQSEFQKIKKGDYVSLYIESLSQWIDNNLASMVERIAKMVWFGLSDDGHFIANIPDNWSNIDFDTSAKGELILRY